MKTFTPEMLLSLDGLSTGDAFGEQFFKTKNRSRIPRRELPPGIWHWTDDTHMALSIVEMLTEEGTIVPDILAKKFAYRYSREPQRGYGKGAARILKMIEDGQDWREASRAVFDGGSYGNGAAMRVAPLGAFFKDAPQTIVEEAKKSAMITHAHPEGQAGAIAVALAASLAAKGMLAEPHKFFAEVLRYLPDSQVKRQIRIAREIEGNNVAHAARLLGTGQRASAQDTVPFCLWCAAHYGDSYENALWTVVAQRGDLDTLGAIVGGVVALHVGQVPETWLNHREPLEG